MHIHIDENIISKVEEEYWVDVFIPLITDTNEKKLLSFTEQLISFSSEHY